MERLSDEKVEIIRSNIELFLSGKITLRHIAGLIDTTHKGTVSKHIRKMLQDDPEKLAEFEQLTDPKRGPRARYLKLYGERIRNSFDKIISREMTKKELANSLGIDQMTLGSLIEEIYQNDPEKLLKYSEIKEKNSNSGHRYSRQHKDKNEKREDLKKDERKISRLDYMRLSRDEKIEWIIYRVNKRQMKCKDENIRTEAQLKNDIDKVIKYFLEKRNSLVDGQKNNFDEETVLLMLFENPNLLTPSEDKKENVFAYLDKIPDVGMDNANHIAMKYPGVLTAALERTASQIEIARDLGILDRCIKTPKRFIPAPKTFYALTMFAIERGITDISKGRTPLLKKYNLTYEDLYEIYPLPDKYKITPEELKKEGFRSRIEIAEPPLSPNIVERQENRTIRRANKER